MERGHRRLPGLLKLSQKYGSALAIDDAHSVGVLGPKGDGTAPTSTSWTKSTSSSAPFSKSLASIGCFAAGSENVIPLPESTTRPLIFTAALPPANTAGRTGRAVT